MIVQYRQVSPTSYAPVRSVFDSGFRWTVARTEAAGPRDEYRAAARQLTPNIARVHPDVGRRSSMAQRSQELTNEQRGAESQQDGTQDDILNKAADDFRRWRGRRRSRRSSGTRPNR